MTKTKVLAQLTMLLIISVNLAKSVNEFIFIPYFEGLICFSTYHL
jgi:hypothetical protein